jgi:SNF2 family DNA or RNA helicase
MLRDYQQTNADKACQILKEKHIVYLAMEMRTGKTLTALHVAEMMNKKNVLFITKKKAMKSIQKDYDTLKPSYKIKIINDHFSNIEKEMPEYDLYIIDEAHSMGAFPQASSRAKHLKKLIRKTDMILLSGTPSPETYGSQLFHQFYLSEWNPFNIDSFYKWAKLYINIKDKFIGGTKINDYSNAKVNEIMRVVQPYFLTCTQEEAGFTENIIEQIHSVDIDSRIHRLIHILKTKKIYQFKDSEDTIVCDTAAKEQQKIHQLFSGTIITTNREYKILDYSKANYIKRVFSGKKIAIFYLFQSEGEALRQTFPNHTDSPEEFNSTNDKVFICQVVSGSMGVNLSTADDLVFYNIHFSSVQYWQARARLSDLMRKRASNVHWIFAKDGIEHKIYDAVIKKKDYTVHFYKRDYDYQKRECGSEKDTGLFRKSA